MFYHHLNADRFHQKYNILDKNREKRIFIKVVHFQAKYIQMSFFYK